MAQTTKTVSRLKLPARIRGKRGTSCDFSARIAFIDRIADLPGIETIERNDETVHGRVDIYLRGDASDRALKRRPAPKICSLDCNHITVSGLNRWDRYQVLANGWGKLTNDQVCVYLPRDHGELEIVWSIIRQAFDRLSGTPTLEPESANISTRDFPRFSRTSRQ
jgi:hypothetical protein